MDPGLSESLQNNSSIDRIVSSDINLVPRTPPTVPVHEGNADATSMDATPFFMGFSNTDPSSGGRMHPAPVATTAAAVQRGRIASTENSKSRLSVSQSFREEPDMNINSAAEHAASPALMGASGSATGAQLFVRVREVGHSDRLLQPEAAGGRRGSTCSVYTDITFNMTEASERLPVVPVVQPLRSVLEIESTNDDQRHLAGSVAGTPVMTSGLVSVKSSPEVALISLMLWPSSLPHVLPPVSRMRLLREAAPSCAAASGAAPAAGA